VSLYQFEKKIARNRTKPFCPYQHLKKMRNDNAPPTIIHFFCFLSFLLFPLPPSFFSGSTQNKQRKQRLSLCEARQEKTREFQTQLLHYFSKSNNKSNHHHHWPTIVDKVSNFLKGNWYPPECPISSRVEFVSVSNSCCVNAFNSGKSTGSGLWE